MRPTTVAKGHVHRFPVPLLSKRGRGCGKTYSPYTMDRLPFRSSVCHSVMQVSSKHHTGCMVDDILVYLDTFETWIRFSHGVPNSNVLQGFESLLDFFLDLKIKRCQGNSKNQTLVPVFGTTHCVRGPISQDDDHFCMQMMYHTLRIARTCHHDVFLTSQSNS